MSITVAYDRSVRGWTSEYSFILDSGISLNNNFYTFNRGRIWRHNSSSEQRNTFYGIQNPTEITLIFNDSPSSVKNFKTLSLEGEGDWSAEIETNIEEGSIDASGFIDKEGKKYAFIRGSDDRTNTAPSLEGSNVGGIGVIDTILAADISSDNLTALVASGHARTGLTEGTGFPTGGLSFRTDNADLNSGEDWRFVTRINFNEDGFDFLDDLTLGDVVLIYGDNQNFAYFTVSNEFEFGGTAQAILFSGLLRSRGVIPSTFGIYISSPTIDVNQFNTDSLSFVNNIPSDLQIGDWIYLAEPTPGGNFTDPVLAGAVEALTDKTIIITQDGLDSRRTQLPVSGNFMLYIKNNQVEKSGLIGFYSIVKLTNSSTVMSELFSVNTNVFETSKE